MGLFDFFKRKRISPEDQKFLDNLSLAFKQIVNTPSEPLSAEEYQKMRELEVKWLESHYDFNSIDGVNRIPLAKNLRCPKTSGVTGEVYYYLRRKAHEHEENDNMDLAIACLRKSNELLELKGAYRKEDCYELVKLLARAGHVDEAFQEKAVIDNRYAQSAENFDKESIRQIIDSAARIRTDLVIMSAHGATCSECAKYQGRVYSLSGKSKQFPRVPDFFFKTGRVHEGCGHYFSTYVHGDQGEQLIYTLSVHPLENNRYGKNIVTFSNRPFVDDRTEACKQAARDARREGIAIQEKLRFQEENMIEIETKRGQEARDYRWIQENLPDKCPKSLSGYRRMKTQNTKNYQALQQMAAELGRSI